MAGMNIEILAVERVNAATALGHRVTEVAFRVTLPDDGRERRRLGLAEIYGTWSDAGDLWVQVIRSCLSSGQRKKVREAVLDAMRQG